MVALWSFGREAARILGVEQFMGFYISAGGQSYHVQDISPQVPDNGTVALAMIAVIASAP